MKNKRKAQNPCFMKQLFKGLSLMPLYSSQPSRKESIRVQLGIVQMRQSVEEAKRNVKPHHDSSLPSPWLLLFIDRITTRFSFSVIYSNTLIACAINEASYHRCRSTEPRCDVCTGLLAFKRLSLPCFHSSPRLALAPQAFLGFQLNVEPSQRRFQLLLDN